MSTFKIAAKAALVATTMVFGSSGALASGLSTTVVTGGDQPRAADPNRRVCRVSTPTASRMTVRTCRTQAEWDEITERSRRGMEDQRRNDETVRPPSSSPRG